MTKPITTFPVIPCKHCTKPFPKTRNDKVFCSNKCRNDWHGERKRLAMEFAYKEGII